MILRRITQHVKEQNWFAVALDFFIVVVGILIAFQITNWNEGRKDRAQERQTIERLHSDFEALAREVREKIEFMEPLVESIDEIEQFIIKGPSDADFEHLQAFYETAFALPGITGQSDTYEQLVSSGDMALLTSDQLRSELLGHATLTRDFLHAGQARREWMRPYGTSNTRLAFLIESMPFEKALAEAGSHADLIVSIGMYKAVFLSQFGTHKQHKESYDKITEMLAEEKSK
jgi:hypothetical protein